MKKYGGGNLDGLYCQLKRFEIKIIRDNIIFLEISNTRKIFFLREDCLAETQQMKFSNSLPYGKVQKERTGKQFYGRGRKYNIFF